MIAVGRCSELIGPITIAGLLFALLLPSPRVSPRANRGDVAFAASACVEGNSIAIESGYDPEPVFDEVLLPLSNAQPTEFASDAGALART